MWIILGLAIGTLVSEDASLASAAGLARVGTVSPLAAGVAVAIGIWAGDLALFLAGRFASRWCPLARWVDRRWRPTELQVMAARLERRAGLAILLSRVLPGTRVPLYVAAGVMRLPATLFLVATAVAVLLWTVIIVGGSQWLS
jgi:membrane protein DedA with SNARE-associated domain